MKLFVYLVVLLLAGCGSSVPYIPETQQLDDSRLPVPDVTLSVSNLSSCTDADEDSIQIDSKSPITVLVHGCNGSAGRFRSLAQLYAFHGQQAVCYSYDDRDKLVDSAEKLAAALGKLANATNNQELSILGHSMGGLIARKALDSDDKIFNTSSDRKLELITVSAPFAGIAAAKYCGDRSLHWLSLGVVPGICWLITGDNWYEITSSSNFITYPKPMLASVQRHLKVVTNEKDACRLQSKDGKCIESDDIFELPEQYQPAIDNGPKVVGVQVDAGHVEIIGNKQVAPRKLISILQEYGMLSPTPPDQRAAFEKLLANLY